MFKIIITLDYEIFGEGSGDVKKHMIEPTSRLLDICDEYGAKLTIMFEVGEYWAFKSEEEKGEFEELSYKPSKLMEQQAVDAIKRGHDVQLHLHPQWIGAKYNGGWKLNHDYWRLANLPNGLGNKDDVFSIRGSLYKGKKDLEKLLKPVNNKYECIAFRAGAWCIQPEKNVIRAMKDVGIKVDTSVFKGGYTNNGEYYDFRNVVNNYGYWWTKEDNICQEGDKGKNIIEIPIYALVQPFILNFKWTKLMWILKTKMIIKNKNFNYYAKQGKNKNLKKNFKILFEKYPIKWDFCKLNHNDLYLYLQKIIINEKNNSYDLGIPVVMIGHSKDFFNERNFDAFLKKVKRNYIDKGIAKFETIQNLVRTL